MPRCEISCRFPVGSSPAVASKLQKAMMLISTSYVPVDHASATDDSEIGCTLALHHSLSSPASFIRIPLQLKLYTERYLNTFIPVTTREYNPTTFPT
jgi:hypothetical protein